MTIISVFYTCRKIACVSAQLMLFCSFVKPTQNKVYLILSYLILSYLILQVIEILPHSMEDNNLFMHIQYQCCWCHGDARSQGIINSYGFALVLSNYSGFSAVRVKHSLQKERNRTLWWPQDYMWYTQNYMCNKHFKVILYKTWSYGYILNTFWATYF